jgi:hypothetical protein
VRHDEGYDRRVFFRVALLRRRIQRRAKPHRTDPSAHGVCKVLC